MNQQISEYRREFYEIYKTQILPIMEEFEKERIPRLRKVLLFWGIMLTLSLLTTALCVFVSLNKGTAELMGISWAVLLFSVYSIPKKYKNELKQKCIDRIIQCFKGNLQHKTNFIGMNELKECGIFPIFNMKGDDDSFYGNYKGVEFGICETILSVKRNSETLAKTYRGVILKFKFNKSMNGTTIIKNKKDSHIKFNFLKFPTVNIVCGIMFLLIFLTESFTNKKFDPMMFSIIILGWLIMIIVTNILYFIYTLELNIDNKIKIEEIKLEDPEFNKKYKAYSTDQVEGRYLITPAFMERFQHIQTAFGSKNVKCSFNNENIIFAIPTNKDFFELGSIWHSLKDPKHMEAFFNELISILMLIDHFKLNEHTGL